MNKRIVFKLSALIVIIILAHSCSKDYQYPNNATGKGGSMARFAIVADYLYIIDDQNLKVFNILQANAPVYLSDVHVGISIETVFAYKNKLFIGSQNGMYIYDITNPAVPQYISETTHFFSCDPVVVNDSLAFVTLHSGGDCRISSNVNQLEIFDITDVHNPSLIRTHFMNTPHGLGIDSCYLFLCHGDYGLGVYNFNNMITLDTLFYIHNIKTYDVIPHNKTLFVIGETGFFQYNYAQIDSIYLMSQILKGQ